MREGLIAIFATKIVKFVEELFEGQDLTEGEIGAIMGIALSYIAAQSEFFHSVEAPPNDN